MMLLSYCKNCVRNLHLMTGLCCLLLVCPGCSSVRGVYGGVTGNAVPDGKHAIPWVYCGIVNDAVAIQKWDEGAMFYALDLPLSFGVDTALLPWTLYAQTKWGNLTDKAGTESGSVDQHGGFQQK